MDEDVLVQELVDRLTFEVETLTGDKVVKFPNTNGTPLNVKVRVRNKDEPKLIQRGVISVPRPDNQLTAVPAIQLVGSDQTILSFNVFMEASSSKESTLKSRKQGFHFFKLGGCLGTTYDKDDDGPYLPSTSNKDALRSRGGSKSDSLILEDVHDLEDLPETHKLNTTSRNQKGLFGKCKPGGCLDPPFGEDKYPYTIPKVQPQLISRPEEVDDQKENINIINSGIKPKQTTKDAKKISNATETVNINDTETKPLLNIFARTGEEHSLESNYSNSIITYPPDLTSSKTENNYHSTEKKTKNRSFESGSPRPSFEYAETYFVPPKDILRHKEAERRYSRELSNDKIKFNDNDTKPSTTVDKHDANKSKKGAEKLQQDTDNSQYKEKAHQELTKQADLNISDNTYLPNKSILRCGESEDDIGGSSKLDAENLKNTDKDIAPAFSTGSYSYDDGDLKKKPINKIQKQSSSTAASNIENNVYIQEMSDVHQAHVKSSGSPNFTNNSNTNVSNPKLIPPISLSGPTDTDNIFDKEDIQKPTTAEIVNLHDTYPEKDFLRCGENEDDLNGASKSPDSVNEKNSNISLHSNEPTSDYFRDTVNTVNYGDPKNVPGKIENQTAFARDAFNENDLGTQGTDEISNSTSSKKANESPYSEPINSALFSNLRNADNVLSKENNTQIHATSQSNIPKHLLAELNIPHDTYSSKTILKSGVNSNDDTDEASSSLKEITSPPDQAPNNNTNDTDTGQVLYKIEKFDIDGSQNYTVSPDSISSENKEFATSSIDTINFTGKTSTHSNTKSKDEVLDSQAENLRKLAVSPNVENVIIQNDLSEQERSSVIFQKTPHITSNEASMYYEDIGKINPIRRSTFPTIESGTSLQKHIEEISTQRNSTIGFDPQLKIGDESVLVDSKATEYLNKGIRITNSNSGINLPQDTKETDSVLVASPSDKNEGNVNEFYINLNADRIPTELVYQQQNIEDTFDKTDSGKPISETSSIANSKKEANYLAPDTQSSSARYHAINNYVYAEYTSQLSTISVGEVDIQPDYLEVYKENEVTNKSITSTQSVTRSPDDFREKVKVEASFAVVDNNQFKFNSISQQDTLNQKVQNDNLISDKINFHPIAKERRETILLNLSFQSYINDNNERIVQTLNPLIKPQPRYIDDTVTAIQSLMRHGNEIRIPVDPEKDLILNLFNKNQKPDEVNKVNTLKRKIMKQPIQSEAGEENRPATFPEDMLKKNLAIIYEKELIPLHDVIKDLTTEINGLLAQQELLKTKLRDAKRSRSLRLIPVNNRCGCRRY